MDKDFIKFLVSLLIILGLIMTGLIKMIICIDKKTCEAKANSLGYQCNYDVWQGCLLIKPDGRRVLLEQLRDIDY